MKKIYKIIRAIVVTLLALAFVTPALVYVLLSLPGIQQDICHRAERELTTLLNMRVQVNAVSISPFNRVTLHHIAVQDSLGDTAINVDRLGAGINMFDLIAKQKVAFNYAEIIGLDARIKRDSANSPLNIQPIISALAPKDKNKPPTRYDLAIRTVVIRNSSVSYNVLSAPRKERGFDSNHICVKRLRADINLPKLSNDDITVNLRRLAMSEQSGLHLTNLSGQIHVSPTGIEVCQLNLQLPQTQLSFGDIAIKYKSTQWLSKNWHTLPINLELLSGSYVNPSNMAWIVPALEKIDCKADINLHASGVIENLVIDSFEISCPNPHLKLLAHGSLTGLGTPNKEMRAEIPELMLQANAPEVTNMLASVVKISPKTIGIINALGQVNIQSKAYGNLSRANVSTTITTSPDLSMLM